MDKDIEDLTRKVLRNGNACNDVKRLLVSYLEQENEEGIKALARGHRKWLYDNDLIDEVSKIVDLGNGRFEYVYSQTELDYGNMNNHKFTVSVQDREKSLTITLYDESGVWIARKCIFKNSSSGEWRYQYEIRGDISTRYHHTDGITHISRDYYHDSYEFDYGAGSIGGELLTPLDNYQELLEMPYDELRKFISNIPHPSKMPLPPDWKTWDRFCQDRDSWVITWKR